MTEELYAFDAEYRARAGVVCGVDEAGRGPLCGPVCVAAVILDATFMPFTSPCSIIIKYIVIIYYFYIVDKLHLL